MIANFKRWWLRRVLREQYILLAGVALIALTLVWLLLWQPAVKGIAQLRTELPVLRTQNAAMQAMANEAKSLQGGTQSAATLSAPERLAALQQGLERAGITAQMSSEGDGSNNNRIRVSIADIDYAAWASWLASAETGLGARTVRASVTALTSPAAGGHVRAEAVLEFTGKVTGKTRR